MQTRPESLWSSSSSPVASPSIQEESAPAGTLFTEALKVRAQKRRRWMLAAVVYAGNFCAAMSFSLQAPFFPKQAEEKGATPTEYGLIFSSFYFTTFLVAPLYGKLVGLISPNYLMVGGLFFNCISVTSFGFVNLVPGRYAFVATAFIIRITEGLGSAAFVTASSTIVMTEFPDNLGTVMASIKTASSVGVIFGPSIGGVLFDAGGYFLPFVVCGGLTFLCTIASIFVIPKNAERATQSSGNAKHFWSGPMVYLFGAAIFGAFACMGFNQATLEPHLRQFGLSTTLVGVIFMTQGIMNCVAVPVWGLLCDRKVNTTLLSAIGCVFVSIYLTFIGPAPFLPIPTKLWLIIPSLACFGIGLGGASICAFIATLQYTLGRGFERDVVTNGLVSSMFTIWRSMGAFTGPALGGALLQHVGYKWGTVVILSFQVILATLLMAVYIQKKCSPGEIPLERFENVVEDDSTTNDSNPPQQQLSFSNPCNSREVGIPNMGRAHLTELQTVST
ncbi:MFS-type transporter SLC18B1-like [Ornithodoros turicata]|uniref:MFS-type transporter SLC18B1-like n=1 Tax=Ornithodoros turicata TaxID=34597 RepID=UPI0031399EEB